MTSNNGSDRDLSAEDFMRIGEYDLDESQAREAKERRDELDRALGPDLADEYLWHEGVNHWAKSIYGDDWGSEEDEDYGMLPFEDDEDETFGLDIKGFKREGKRNKKKKMKVDGAGLRTTQRHILSKARQESERQKDWNV